jgi:hypothetical protein
LKFPAAIWIRRLIALPGLWVALLALGLALLGSINRSSAQEVCGDPTDHSEVLAALVEIESSVDPCGQSGEIRDLMDRFRACAARGCQICLDPTGSRNWIERSSDDGARRVPATIRWNPGLRDELERGCEGDAVKSVPRDPVAQLLHEIVHAVQDCSSLDPGEFEFDAVRVENIYRRARGLCQRTRYGDLRLPAEMLVQCDPGHCSCEGALPPSEIASGGGRDADAATAGDTAR